MDDERASSAPSADPAGGKAGVAGVWIMVKGPPFAEYTWPIPKIVVDGIPQGKVKWGRSGFFTLEPGRRRIEASFWFINPKAGRASVEVDMASGQIRRFTYAAPRNAFLKGKITED